MKKIIKILGFIFALVCLTILSFIIYHNYKNNNYDNEKAKKIWKNRQESFKKKDTEIIPASARIITQATASKNYSKGLIRNYRDENKIINREYIKKTLK